MDLKLLEKDLSVCKVVDYSQVHFDSEYWFIGSTYNTDYIFVKASQYDEAIAVLKASGYTIIHP